MEKTTTVEPNSNLKEAIETHLKNNYNPKHKYKYKYITIDYYDSGHVDISLTEKNLADRNSQIVDDLSGFLEENLSKSKEEKWTDEMFGAGWIAALTHVKVNFLNNIQNPRLTKSTQIKQ